MRLNLLSLALLEVACKPASPDSDLMIAKPNPSIKNAPTTHVVKSTVFVGNSVGGCSGVIVGNRRILTAQHCIGENLYVYFGNDLKVAADFAKANKRLPENVRAGINPRVHRDFDMATFDLKGDIPSGFQVVPIHSTQTSLRKNQQGVAAGFGLTGITAEGKTTGDSRFLRWGYLSFDKWNKEQRLQSGQLPSFLSWVQIPGTYVKLPNNLSWSPGDGGSMVCAGDSGGPIYAKLGNDLWGLLGLATNADCKTNAVAIDVRSYQGWILEGK